MLDSMGSDWLDSGVYCFKNVVTGKMYVGSSCRLAERWADHLNLLNGRRHHSYKLQRDWLAFGADNFEYTILEFVDPQRVLEAEQAWMDKLNPKYNILKLAGTRRGHKHSPETKEKMRQAKLGTKRSEEAKRKCSESLRGRTLSAQHAENISKAKKLAVTDDFRNRISAINKGRVRSAQEKERLRSYRVGVPFSKESVEKRRKTLERQPQSVKDKRAAATAERFAKKYRATSPTGEVFDVVNLAEFSRAKGLHIGGLPKVASGSRKQYKGWLCIPLTE